MEINFNNIINSLDEMKSIDRTNPYNVAALAIHAICNYCEDKERFYDMLSYLMGEYQEVSNMMKSNINDRMSQNDKAPFIGKSYFVGSTPENDYTPTSYSIIVKENDYSKPEEGYLRLLLKSGGADSERFITLRLAKDGNYYLWSDSIIGLLADIRKPESTNPWA